MPFFLYLCALNHSHTACPHKGMRIMYVTTNKINQQLRLYKYDQHNVSRRFKKGV